MPIFAIIAQAISIAGTIAGTVMNIQGQKASAKAQENAAEFNADQAKKQTAYDESLAQENMRRKRSDNQRELARRRASAARGGLQETGAVTSSLVETSDRLQTEVDDIWKRAAKNSEYLEGKANMGMWEAKTNTQASKYNQFGTAMGGVADVFSIATSDKYRKAPVSNQLSE